MERSTKNIVSKATVTTTRASDGTALYGSLTSKLYDGIICSNSSDNGSNYGNSSSFTTGGKTPEGHITVALDDSYEMSTIYLVGHHTAAFAIVDYEIYVSNDETSLYDESNLVATFAHNSYRGDSLSDVRGKLNAEGVSEGQIFSFTGEEKPEGSYVGFKLNDVAKNTGYNLLFLTELGVEGTKYVDPYTVTCVDSNAQAAVTAGTLTTTSNYENTSLQTAFAGDAFATRKDNNLLTAANITTKAKLDGNAIFGSLTANLYDGIINVDSTDAAKYGNSKDLNGTDPQGYITVALDGTYDISSLYMIGTHISAFAIQDYEVYVSDSEGTLYNSENLVSTFKYTAYQGNSMSATGGKLNGSGLSEGQIFTFNGDKKPRGSYVGFKLNDAS
ncbi:MAG: hypothetical protein IKV86_00170 [Clostridia bacterium]|nr:hypothetical protein [Clostridia bacterium]